MKILALSEQAELQAMIIHMLTQLYDHSKETEFDFDVKVDNTLSIKIQMRPVLTSQLEPVKVQ